MRIFEKGDPSLPPIVLLHGLASSSRCWERNVAALQSGRRLVLADLFAGARRRFSLTDTAERLADELVRRGAAPASVVGHSMGGLVALQLAATAPELVSQLVLVDVPAVRVPRRRLSQIGAVARSSLRREATGMGLILGCVMRTSPLALVAATRATLQADLVEQAQAAQIPTLLVWGAEDRIVPLEIGERLASSMPAAQLVVVPRAGHQPMWETPAPFNAAVAAFLDRPAGAWAAYTAG